jgi:glycosyltransferase involved in cell wall biosynthesis
VKILHIVTGPMTGGAAIGVQNLVDGLNAHSVQADIIFLSGTKTQDRQYKFELNKLLLFKKRFSRLITKIINFILQRDVLFNYSRIEVGCDISEISKKYDILHLHWVNGFVSVNNLLKVEIPMVITLRDMWFFTGGCHYSLDCESYTNQCNDCPIFSVTNPFVRRDLESKKALAQLKPRYTAISSWLAGKAKLSAVLKDEDVLMLKNSVNIDPFLCAFKDVRGREKFNIVVGAQNIDYGYKGADLAVDILNNLNPDHFEVTFFGKISPKTLNKIKLGSTSHGFISNVDQLASVYRSGDVFLFTSTQEAFGKTIVEAMAAGLIVVAVKGSGPDDIVTHGENGFLYDACDLPSFVETLEMLRIMDASNLAVLKKRAQVNAKRYAPEVVAPEYIALYRSLK